MSKLTVGSLLLITTALCSFPAMAQTSSPQMGQSSSAGTAPAAAGSAEAPAASQEQVDISIPGGSADGDEIVVIGTNIPNTIRATPEVVSVLSTEDIARTGEGDIAAALNRLTGLNVVGNGFVYVRGLGDRYSLALLNGSPLPSPEPLKRVIPLDIFPTSLLASALVQKSYSANYPGEFGGGVINLTTRAIPDETFFSIGVSGGGDSETTGQLGYTYYGSDTDWTGFDDGTRDIPGPLREAFQSGNLITEGANFTGDQLEAIGSSLVNAPTTVLQTNRKIPINWAADLAAGTSFDVGDVRLGVIAAAGYDNSWRTRDAIQQVSVGTVPTPNVDFRSVLTENRIVVNGLLGFGAEFGEHKVRWTNLYIRDTLKQGRLSRGRDDVANTEDVISQNTFWFERQLIDTQFIGEFKFGGLSLDLRGTYANSQRKSPYERSFSYVYDPAVQDFVNSLEGPNQSARISFSDLNEDVYAGGIDVTYNLPTSRPASISAGGAYTDTQRSSVRRDFRFLPAGSLPSAVAQLRPDFLLSDYTIQAYDILLTETSGQAGAAAYDAGLRTKAAYVQGEAELLDGIRVTAGVRYEEARQVVRPGNLFGNANDIFLTPTTLKNDYFLPAATITWNFAEDMQLRVAGSKTIARPQFRELARQVYQDTDSDRQFFGNPFLVDSKLFNLETRYEYFFERGQRFTAAAFYKKIDNPIEAFGFVTSSSLTTSFANAPKAQLYGAEFELEKYFPLDLVSQGAFFQTRRLVLIGNYTYTQSKIQIGDTDTVILPFGELGEVRDANLFFTDGDPLTGQSDHLVNVQIGLEDTDRLSQQTLLLTYASKRVTNRGPQEQPDIVEKPGLRLDFVARQGVTLWGSEIELKFEARNITGTRYQEYQAAGDARIDVNSYDVGTSFSLGASVTF